MGMNLLVSTFSARFIAGNYNYIINKKIVFRSKSDVLLSIIKYWALVILLGSVSYLGIQTLVSYTKMNLLLSKAILESLLFFISFAVQRDLIFYSGEEAV